MSEENTYGTSLAITRCIIDVQTVSSGACTADFGVGSGASTSYDNVIDGLNLGAGAKMLDNLGDEGTNGSSVQKWPDGEYINGSKATGASSGLVGTYAIFVVDMN